MKRFILALALLLAALIPAGQPAHAIFTPAPRQVSALLHPVMRTKPPITSHVVNLSRVVHGIAAGDGDLTTWAPTVRNQQSNGSCVTFATTTIRAWLAYHDAGVQLDAYGFAPMLQYSRLVTDPSQGTSFEDNLTIEERDGAEPSAQYSYGEQAALTDWKDQPTAGDIARAVPWRISNYALLYNSGSPNAAGADPAAIASQALHDGYPVLLGISVYEPFMQFDGQGEVAPGGQTLYGYHAIAGFRANADGSVDIENSWGTSWGRQGWATLSREFIRQNVFAIYIVMGTHVAPTPAPITTATAVPPPSPTPMMTATAVPTPSPMPTMTAVPTFTPAATATTVPTRTPIPTSTPAPTATPKPRRHHRRHARGGGRNHLLAL